MTRLPSLSFYIIAGAIILQPSTSQKWKEMEIAQKHLSEYLNSTSTTSPLDELVSELTPNRSLSLECMVFGNLACEYLCDLKCLMYGCVCAGICVPNTSQDTCECRESYRIGDSYVGSHFFRFLPLANLWDYRFESNLASVIVSGYIKQDLKTTQAVAFLLQDPRVTGTQIKRKLMQMFPETGAWLLSQLRPIVRGAIDKFLSPRRHFVYPAFTYYLNEYTKAKYAQIENLEIKKETGLEKYLEDRENIKFMARQLLLFPSKHMQEVMETFSAITGISYEEFSNLTDIHLYTGQNPDHQLTPRQIDEIIQAGAFSQLLEFETIPKEDYNKAKN